MKVPCSLGLRAIQTDVEVMALHFTPQRHAQRRGLTLLETLLATAILLIVVTAVMSAMSAGRAQSNHAKQVVSATLAAEMLMARVTAVQSESFLTGEAWTNHFTLGVQAGGCRDVAKMAAGGRFVDRHVFGEGQQGGGDNTVQGPAVEYAHIKPPIWLPVLNTRPRTCGL